VTTFYQILKLIRIHNCLIAAIGVWLGGYLCRVDVGGLDLALATAAIALLCGAGNALNDFFDFESDKLNHPERPLPSGALPLYVSILVSIILTLVALFFAIAIGPGFLTVCFIIAVLLFAYNSVLQKTFFWGNLTVSFLGGTALLAGGYVDGIENLLVFPGAIIPAIFAFLFHFGREIVKDIADLDGDRAGDYGAIPIKIGIRGALLLASTVYIMLIILTLLPFVVNQYNLYYLILVIGLVDLPILAVILYLSISNSEKKYRLAGSLLKLLMLTGLLSFFIGTDRLI